MTLRSKFLSVLVLLGLVLTIPLGFHLREQSSIEADLAKLRALEADASEPAPGSPRATPASASPSPAAPTSAPPPEAEAPGAMAAAKLARRAQDSLRKGIGRLDRFVRDPSRPPSHREDGLRALSAFARDWDALKSRKVADLKKVAGGAGALGLSAGASGDDWARALASLRRHRPEAWPEDPLNLQMAARHTADQRGSSEAADALKAEARAFFMRLEGVVRAGPLPGPKAAPPRAAPAPTPVVEPEPDQDRPDPSTRDDVLMARIDLLEAAAAQKHHEITQLAFLLATAVTLALYFARLLLKDVLDPLEVLRVAINNTAMSGQPSPVKVHGPPELQKLLVAFNRLVDTVAAEGGKQVEKVRCDRCGQSSDRGDNYCRWCGFPIGTPSQIVAPTP